MRMCLMHEDPNSERMYSPTALLTTRYWLCAFNIREVLPIVCERSSQTKTRRLAIIVSNLWVNMIRSVLLKGSCPPCLRNARNQQRHEPLLQLSYFRARKCYSVAFRSVSENLLSARRGFISSRCSLPSENETSPISVGHPKRPFCKSCRKALKMCICKHFQGVVQNKTKITILQSPKEKDHALGSCRIAMLGLENISLVIAREAEESIRREQRCHALKTGRRPCLNTTPILPEVEALRISNLMSEVFRDASNTIASNNLRSNIMDGAGVSGMDTSIHMQDVKVNCGYDVHCLGHSSVQIPTLEDLKALIPPGVALLYPSEKAAALCSSHVQKGDPAVCHLIVLDGTWSKAKRLYFENPWLHELPHYKLIVSTPSLYKGVRKEPKPEYVSTLESIVYALKVFEPDINECLDMLLAVFNSMLDDQRLFLSSKRNMHSE